MSAEPVADHRDILAAIAQVSGGPTSALLSPPARAIVTALDAGVGTALGLGNSLSEAGSEALSSVADELAGVLGATIADIVGNISEVIPIVGPVIKALISILSFAFGGGGGPSPSQECSKLFQVFKPFQTGSLFAGSSTVPADLFAKAYGIERIYTDDPKAYADTRRNISPGREFASFQSTLLTTGPLDCRPALGMALMQLTEGCIADLRDFDWPAGLAWLRQAADEDARRGIKTPRQLRQLWERAIVRDARMASAQWARRNPRDKKRGLPRGWRDRFQRMRRGIEASWGKTLPPGVSSDGGTALWIAYLDLLTTAFAPERDYLSWDFAEFLYARQSRCADRGTSPQDVKMVGPLYLEHLTKHFSDSDVIHSDDLIGMPPTWIWYHDPCPRLVAASVRNIVESWQHSIHPYYAQGQQRIAELEKSARDFGRSVGASHAVNKRAGTTAASVPPSPSTSLPSGSALAPPPPPAVGVEHAAAEGSVDAGGIAVALPSPVQPTLQSGGTEGGRLFNGTNTGDDGEIAVVVSCAAPSRAAAVDRTEAPRAADVLVGAGVVAVLLLLFWESAVDVRHVRATAGGVRARRPWSVRGAALRTYAPTR